MESKRYSVKKTVKELDGEYYIDFTDEECIMLGLEVGDTFNVSVEKDGVIILTNILTDSKVPDTVKG